MKYLILLFVILSSVVNADEYQFSYIAGGWSLHPFDHTTHYNGEHHARGLSVQNDNYYTQLVGYKNSFYYDSYSLAVGKKVGHFTLGAVVATGYDKVGLSNIGRFAVAPAFSYQHPKMSIFRFNMAADAMFVDLAIPLN